MRFRTGVSVGACLLAAAGLGSASGCRRTQESPTEQVEPVSAMGLVGRLHLPDGDRRKAVLLVLGGSEGGLRSSEAMASQFARNGYVAMSLAYFGAPGLPASLKNIRIEYVQAAITYLEERVPASVHHLVVVGGSRGAELALVTASIDTRIKGVIAYSPSAVVWGPFSLESTPSDSGWSYQDAPLAFLRNLAAETPRPNPYSETREFSKDLDDGKEVGRALIHVERIAGPVLLLSGGDDQIWPSQRMAEMIVSRLKESKHGFSDKSVSFPGAGHAFEPGVRTDATSVVLKDRSVILLGGSPAANAEAQKEAFQEALRFLASQDER